MGQQNFLLAAIWKRHNASMCICFCESFLFVIWC